MNSTSVLVGSPYFRTRMFIPVVIITGILGLGWLYALNLIEDSLPQQIEFVFLAVPVLITVGAVGIFAYKGEGVLFGWLIGAAFVFGPITLMGYDMFQKEMSMGREFEIGMVSELLLGSVMWSSLFALIIGAIGLILGGGLRFLTSRRT